MLSDTSSLSGMCFPCLQCTAFSHTTKGVVGTGVGGQFCFCLATCALRNAEIICWDSVWAVLQNIQWLWQQAKNKLQNKGEIKNVDIQHLVTEQNNRTGKKL